MHDLPGAWRRTALGAGLIAPDGTSVPTIFAEMTSLAASTGALNLGQGFPDEDGPEVVLEAARRAIADGVNQYAPGRGFPTCWRRSPNTSSASTASSSIRPGRCW